MIASRVCFPQRFATKFASDVALAHGTTFPMFSTRELLEENGVFGRECCFWTTLFVI